MTETLTTIRAGETLSIALVATAGDPAQITEFRAVLKKLGVNNALPTTASPEAAVFSASASQNVTPGYPGYTLTLSAAQTEGLAPGMYATDARFRVAGGVIITEPVLIAIRAPVTGAAA